VASLLPEPKRASAFDDFLTEAEAEADAEAAAALADECEATDEDEATADLAFSEEEAAWTDDDES
jgi:hypothetical protein